MENNNKILGVTSYATSCGIKKNNLADLFYVEFCDNTKIAAAFTTSSIVSDTVTWNKKNLSLKKNPKILVVNSGNANCFTGKYGMVAIKKIASYISKIKKISTNQIYICSTGVIGQKLPYERILAKIPECIKLQSIYNLEAGATAIMTTDKASKIRSITTQISDKKVNITAMAKGAGMAAPNMATVLGYIFTDANISQNILQKILIEVIEDSFNAFTVDGDMSTNDTIMMLATCKALNKSPKSINDSIILQFKKDLKKLLIDICDDIILGGEGVKKIMKIHITGSKSKKIAKNIALNIANSPLVKTAIHGADPNWGRIIMAIGKSKEQINLKKFCLNIGKYNIIKNGELNAGYDEKSTTSIYMKESKIIDIFVNLGYKLNFKNNVTITGCDLSKGYIEINADYRS